MVQNTLNIKWRSLSVITVFVNMLDSYGSLSQPKKKLLFRTSKGLYYILLRNFKLHQFLLVHLSVWRDWSGMILEGFAPQRLEIDEWWAAHVFISMITAHKHPVSGVQGSLTEVWGHLMFKSHSHLLRKPVSRLKLCATFGSMAYSEILKCLLNGSYIRYLISLRPIHCRDGFIQM